MPETLGLWVNLEAEVPETLGLWVNQEVEVPETLLEVWLTELSRA